MMRIVVIDEHALGAQAVAAVLEQQGNVDVIEVARDPRAAVQIAQFVRADLFLMEVEFSDIPLEDGIRSLRQVCPEAVFAFLTHWDQDRFVRLALEHKVAGYLLKTESLETLVEGIGRLSRGQRVFSAEIETRLARVNGDLQLVKPRCPAFATLTQRELELLRHLSLGASLKEAAAVMNVSYKTADNQKANLMRKLGIHDRVELARFAIRERLVRADTGFDYPAVIRGRSTETKTAGPRPFAVAQ